MLRNSMSTNESWERNYKYLKRYNVYPFADIISNVKKHKSKAKNQKASDLGCGDGNACFLEREGYKVYAADSSLEAIKLTKKILKKNKNNVFFS